MKDMKRYLTIVTILTLFLICNTQFLTSKELIVPFLVGSILFFCLKIDSRFFGVLTIILLMCSAICLVSDNVESSDYLASGAYYSLCITVLLTLLNEVLKRKYDLKFEEIIPKIESLKKHKKTIQKIKPVTVNLTMNDIFRRMIRSKQFNHLNTLSDEYLLPLTLMTIIVGLAFSYLYTLHLKNPYMYPGADTRLLFVLIPLLVVTGTLFSIKILERIRKSADKKMWSNVILFSLLSLLGNVFVYLYHVFSARELSPTEYGTLNALLFVFMLLMIISSAIGKLIVKIVSELYSKNEKQKLKKTLSRIFLIEMFATLIFVITLFFGKQYVIDYLHVESDFLIVLLIISTFLSTLFSVISAYLQGVKSFVKAGIGIFFSTGGRFLFLIGLLYISCVTVECVFFAIPLALGLGLLVTITVSWKEIKEILNIKIKNNIEIDYRKHLATFTSILMQTLGNYLLFGPETIILEHRFFGEDIGFYSVASNLSRIIIYILSPVTTVFFSYFASQNNENDFRLIKKSLSMVVGLGVAMFLVYNLFPALVISLLFTTKYLQARTYLLFLSAAAVMYSINILLVNYLITRNNMLGSIVLVLCGIGLMAEMNFVKNILVGSLCVQLNNLIALIAICTLVVIEKRKKI